MASKKAFTLALGNDYEYEKSVRRTWAFSSVTRVVKDKTKYDRKREKHNWKKDMD